MFSIGKTAVLGAFVWSMAASTGALSQDLDAGLADSLMAMDGSVSGDAGIAAATGWNTCSVARTGAGWGNHYVALTCPGGPFTNKWHIMENSQKDAMLATALSAATSNNDVQVYIAAGASGSYNVIRALYLQK